MWAQAHPPGCSSTAQPARLTVTQASWEVRSHLSLLAELESVPGHCVGQGTLAGPASAGLSVYIEQCCNGLAEPRPEYELGFRTQFHSAGMLEYVCGCVLLKAT